MNATYCKSSIACLIAFALVEGTLGCVAINSESQLPHSRGDVEQKYSAKSGKVPLTTVWDEYLGLIEDLNETSDHFRVSIDNSSVIVKTANIERVVSVGAEIIPFIVDRMRDPEITFDMFVRLYSAADQILREDNPRTQVSWYGGARVDMKLQKLSPGSQQYNQEFREYVIDSIEKAVTVRD